MNKWVNLHEVVARFCSPKFIPISGPPKVEVDHQIFGAGGPVVHCSKKLISITVRLARTGTSQVGHWQFSGWRQTD